MQHVRRANYQAAVWRQALLPQFDIPTPDGHGWIIEDGCIKVKWMTQPAAPADVLNVTSCKCKTGCTSDRCSCHRTSLACTDVCGCVNCLNELNGNCGLEPEVAEDGDDSADDDL